MKLHIMQYSPASHDFQTFSAAPCSQTPSIYVLPLVWKTRFDISKKKTTCKWSF